MNACRRARTDKFCDSCRRGVKVPAEHVRALSPAEKDRLKNWPSEGFWNALPPPAEGRVRIINNTAGCSGPWLVLYKEHVPPTLEWDPMPPNWVSEDGLVELVVAKGTLVPSSELTAWRPPPRPLDASDEEFITKAAHQPARAVKRRAPPPTELAAPAAAPVSAELGQPLPSPKRQTLIPQYPGCVMTSTHDAQPRCYTWL